jgi:nucleotide-binding universal stress UspA family protein
MRVLLAVDGSPHSHVALEEVASRDWPAGTEIEVLTVLHSGWPLLPDPSFIMAAAHVVSMRNQKHDAPELLNSAAEQLRAQAPGLVVTTRVLEGTPHETIVQEAADWTADLIVLGSHGRGTVRRAVLGSVATAVAAEAPCAVEIVRLRQPSVITRHGEQRDSSESLKLA